VGAHVGGGGGRGRGRGDERELALEIGLRNARAIESCRLLVAHLDGQEVDSGTAAEVGFAMARGLRCFGLRSDLRQTGEPGVAVNLQVEYFVIASGGRVVRGLKELLSELATATGRPS
jgi:nucleoside 2-deoxyribosyltransferase